MSLCSRLEQMRLSISSKKNAERASFFSQILTFSCRALTFQLSAAPITDCLNSGTVGKVYLFLTSADKQQTMSSFQLCLLGVGFELDCNEISD